MQRGSSLDPSDDMADTVYMNSTQAQRRPARRLPGAAVHQQLDADRHQRPRGAGARALRRPRHAAGDLLGARRRDRHHAGLAAHEARGPPARPDHRHAVGHRRRADLRRGDLARRASGCCASAPWCGASTTPTASTTASPPPTWRARDFKAIAISLVLAGGLVGGILGPTSSRWTVDLLGPKFMGAYLALIGFALVTMVLLRFIRIPTPTAAEQAATGRPLREIARAAEVHRRGARRRDRLRRDELPHDLDADRDAGLRPSLRRRGVRHLLARDRHVRAVVLHRAR